MMGIIREGDFVHEPQASGVIYPSEWNDILFLRL
jgi:hypothetical protein